MKAMDKGEHSEGGDVVLHVEHLTKRFSGAGKDVLAVDDMSFDLYRGEVLGIVGESGSGKSTVARMLTRLTDPTEGKVVLDGEDITHVKGKAFRVVTSKMQMVFQTPAGSFDPRKTIGYGITEALTNRGVPEAERRERAVKELEHCGLTAQFYDRYPLEISGGECQRAAIARALVVKPQVIIFDEATSALDVTVQKQVIDLLKELHEKEKLSYLFICHNLALVQSFCSRVLVMQDGRVVEEGTPDEVIFRPQTDYTKKLIESVLE